MSHESLTQVTLGLLVLEVLAVCHYTASSPRMASDAEVAVFIDTNLGTHLAMAVSPDTTVGDFKRELERTHYSCFPKLGEIEVYALMVKRKSCFYHLPSSMPIKYAFQHQEGTWFLHIEAMTLKGSDGACLSNFAATEVGDHKCDGNHITNSLLQNIGQEAMISSGKKLGAKALPQELLKTYLIQRKKKSIILKYQDREIEKECPNAAEWNSSSITKNPTNISSKPISAAGISHGYLLNCSGVSKHASSPSTDRAIQGMPEEQLRTKSDNYCSSIQIGVSPPFMVRTPPKQSLFLSPANQTTGIPRDKFVSSEVGKRIVIASNNIRISDNQRPVTPLSKFRDRKLLCYKNLSRAKFLVFEISDSDD